MTCCVIRLLHIPAPPKTEPGVEERSPTETGEVKDSSGKTQQGGVKRIKRPSRDTSPDSPDSGLLTRIKIRFERRGTGSVQNGCRKRAAENQGGCLHDCWGHIY